MSKEYDRAKYLKQKQDPAWVKRNRERSKKWYEANKEKHHATSKRWAIANRDKARSYKKRWLLNHPEQAREYKRLERLSKRGEPRFKRRDVGFFCSELRNGRISIDDFNRSIERIVARYDARAQGLVPRYGKCALQYGEGHHKPTKTKARRD